MTAAADEQKLSLGFREAAGGICVVDVAGEVDLETSPRLKEAIQTAAARGDGRVVVNMAGVSYLDSSGLGVLLGARKRFHPRPLPLFGFRAPVARLLALTGLDGLFDVHATEADALAHAAARTAERKPIDAVLAADDAATVVPVQAQASGASAPDRAATGEMARRVVIVTGGGGGVGQHVALCWLREGASVLVVDRPGAPGMDALRVAWDREPDAERGRLALFGGDVATAEGAARMVDEAARVFGAPADTLLHLVGAFASGPLDAPDAPETWRRMMTLNLDSAFFCYRALVPVFRARGGGWIVGLGARALVSPPPRMAAYAASKAGLLALTQSLSEEVKRDNIHVNLLLASTIDTPANRTAMGDAAAASWVTPGDIAQATLFLCSASRGRALHGATLEVYATA